MRKKKLKREYFAPWCTITMVQAECPLLTGSIHVTVNENSSNEQNWDNDNRFEGTPHKNGRILTIAGSEQRVKLLLKMTTKANYCIKQKNNEKESLFIGAF